MSNYKALVDYFRACEQERSAARAKYERDSKAALAELDATLWAWFGCTSQTLLEVDGAQDPSGLYRGFATLKFGAHSLKASFSLPVVGGSVAVRIDGRNYPRGIEGFGEAMYRAFFDEFATLITERLSYMPPVDRTSPRSARGDDVPPSARADEG